MNTEITVEPRAIRAFEARLAKYGKIVDKSHGDAMIELGRAVARQLATKTQPFGLSDAIGKKYERSIRSQAGRALNNANLSAGSGDMPTEHGSRRDNRGRVPKGLREKGQFQRSPFEVEERNTYRDHKSLNAGMLKAAWVAAGQALGGPKMSRIGKWISRHVYKMEGVARVITGGAFKDHEVWLTNAVSYAGRALRKGDMQKAVHEAFRKQIKHMNIQIAKAEEKIARMENAASK